MRYLLHIAVRYVSNAVLFAVVGLVALAVMVSERIALWQRNSTIEHDFGGDEDAYERARWKEEM